MEDQEITRGKVVLAGGWVGWGVESWKQQKQLQMQMVMGVMCRMHMNGLWHTRVNMDRRTRMNTLCIHMSVLLFFGRLGDATEAGADTGGDGCGVS